MKLSERLQACAELVRPGGGCADVGTDHGFLPIYLIQKGICPLVYAADLREKPLETAKKNAREAGVADQIRFFLSDGMKSIPLEGIATVIISGMGGDLIAEILEAAKGQWTPERRFVLQPQSGVSELRGYLLGSGFAILRERLVEDAGFVYTVLEVQHTGSFAAGAIPEPGVCFVPGGAVSGSPEAVRRYMERAIRNTKKTVSGLMRASVPDPEKLAYYQAGLQALQQWEEDYENRK